MFVRLVLFTGLRLGELLGLRWEDIDFRAGILHVRRTLNRLNKMKRPLQPGEPTTEIVIQTPKSQNSIRAIPLLPAVLQELQGWQYVQQKDAELAGDQYNASGYIVTNPLGGMIEPRTFKDYYHQILQASGLCHFTFHALRHRFASRAMEQGMDPKTLSEIMGHSGHLCTCTGWAQTGSCSPSRRSFYRAAAERSVSVGRYNGGQRLAPV